MRRRKTLPNPMKREAFVMGAGDSVRKRKAKSDGDQEYRADELKYRVRTGERAARRRRKFQAGESAKAREERKQTQSAGIKRDLMKSRSATGKGVSEDELKKIDSVFGGKGGQTFAQRRLARHKKTQKIMAESRLAHGAYDKATGQRMLREGVGPQRGTMDAMIAQKDTMVRVPPGYEGMSAAEIQAGQAAEAAEQQRRVAAETAYQRSHFALQGAGQREMLAGFPTRNIYGTAINPPGTPVMQGVPSAEESAQAYERSADAAAIAAARASGRLPAVPGGWQIPTTPVAPTQETLDARAAAAARLTMAGANVPHSWGLPSQGAGLPSVPSPPRVDAGSQVPTPGPAATTMIPPQPMPIPQQGPGPGLLGTPPMPAPPEPPASGVTGYEKLSPQQLSEALLRLYDADRNGTLPAGVTFDEELSKITMEDARRKGGTAPAAQPAAYPPPTAQPVPPTVQAPALPVASATPTMYGQLRAPGMVPGATAPAPAQPAAWQPQTMRDELRAPGMVPGGALGARGPQGAMGAAGVPDWRQKVQREVQAADAKMKSAQAQLMQAAGGGGLPGTRITSLSERVGEINTMVAGPTSDLAAYVLSGGRPGQARQTIAAGLANIPPASRALAIGGMQRGIMAAVGQNPLADDAQIRLREVMGGLRQLVGATASASGAPTPAGAGGKTAPSNVVDTAVRAVLPTMKPVVQGAGFTASGGVDMPIMVAKIVSAPGTRAIVEGLLNQGMTPVQAAANFYNAAINSAALSAAGKTAPGGTIFRDRRLIPGTPSPQKFGTGYGAGAPTQAAGVDLEATRKEFAGRLNVAILQMAQQIAQARSGQAVGATAQ